MHTAEEVRKEADCFRHIKGDARTREMLLAYADLLEAMEELNTEGANYMVGPIAIIIQRAAEKARNRK